MRAMKWGAGILGVIVLAAALVFFGNFFSKNSPSVKNNANMTTKATSSSTKRGIQITGSHSNDSYQTVIKDGRYLTSKTRGITASNDSNNFNSVNFETDLLSFSKNHFDPNKYIFQEGQYLSADKAIDWLNRKSDDNPDGLNPEDNGKFDNDRNPLYLQTIDEQDFMTSDHNQLKLAGIVIGLAMKTEDIYQKEQYGADFKQTISKADRIAHGQEIANEVIKRYRQLEGVSADTPIYVAMYAQAPEDTLSGGNFYSWAESKQGSDLTNWNDLDRQTIILPMQAGTDNDKSVGNALNTSFTNFSNKLQTFFPNLSSVAGQAAYENGDLRGLNIQISTQFYSATEIESFANYIAQTAPSYLPNGVPIQIRMEAATGMQAYINKTASDKDYQVTILGSY